MLNVAIAIEAPAPVRPDAAAVVSHACEAVIGPGRCPVASDLPRGAVAAWFALVHTEDAALTNVRIEFRDRFADGVLIEQRTLAFRGGEGLDARLASIGTVIAALAAAREGAIAPGAASVRPRPSGEPVAAVSAPRAGASASLGFDMAAVAVPALGGGVDRFGGLVRANVDFEAPLLVSAGFEYATSGGGDPRFGWFTGLAGVGTRVAPRGAAFDLELRGAFVFAWTHVSTGVGGAPDSGSQGSWGGRVGATLLWRAWPRVAYFVGMDGTLVTPHLVVAVGSEPPVGIPTATCGFFAGVRIFP